MSQDIFVYLDNLTVTGRTQDEHDRNVSRCMAALKKYALTLNSSKTISLASLLNILGYFVGHGRIQSDVGRLKPLQELELPRDLTALQRVLGMCAYYAK